MIGIIIIIISIALLNKQIGNLRSEAQEKLEFCSSVQEALKVRKKFDKDCKECRIRAIIFCLICLYGIAFAIYADDLFEILILLSIFAPLSFALDYLRIKKHTDKYTFHPVSLLSVHDINFQPYALFLRGFENDDYNPKSGLGISNTKDKKKIQFSEPQMQEAIKAHCCNHIVAIGMPKEVFAPIGCERVYCEPEEWKQDVFHLINNSLFNIVLLNDRPNCLYELEHCLQVASKTYCIVCDRNIYDNVRKSYNTLPSVSIQEPFFFRLDNADITYTYNPNDFAKQIREALNNTQNEEIRQQLIELDKEKKEDQEFKRIEIGCCLVVLIIIVVCAIFGR